MFNPTISEELEKRKLKIINILITYIGGNIPEDTKEELTRHISFCNKVINNARNELINAGAFDSMIELNKKYPFIKEL